MMSSINVSETSPLFSKVEEGRSWVETSDSLRANPISTPLELLADAKEGKRSIGALQLMMMVYFMTCGGPFGIETAVNAGGPLLTILGSLIIQALWSFPQALMGAELSLMFNYNGGPVVLVAKAFGPVMGFINSYANAACSLVSQANLAVLFVQYMPYQFSYWQEWGVRIAFISVTTLINIFGVTWVSRMSLLFLLLMFSPFIAALGLVIQDDIFDPSVLLQAAPWDKVQWSVLISTCIWSNGGFDAVGALAGEVRGGQKTFLLGTLGAFPLVFVNYLIPVFICYMPLPRYEVWLPGYFTVVAYKMNIWLGRWMAVASAISLFGQFSAGLAPTARVVWAMARGSDGSPRYLPSFISWCHRDILSLFRSWVRHTGTIRPVAAIIFCGVVCTLISALPFVFLIQLFLVIRLTNLFSEYASLIYLRYKMPNQPRPWKVPLGNVGVWLIVCPSLIIASFAMATAEPAVLIAGGGATGAIVLLGIGYGIYIYKIMPEDERIKYLAAMNETEAINEAESARRTVN